MAPNLAIITELCILAIYLNLCIILE